MRHRNALAGVLLALSLHSPASAQGQEPASGVVEFLARGYAVLSSDPRAALRFFEEAVRADSTHLLARKQLGSLYITLGRPEDALREFLGVQRLAPSDTIGLQIAYLLNALGRNEEALPFFENATSSADSSIASVSRTAVLFLTLQRCRDRAPWWWHVYAAPYLEGRLDDLILPAFVVGGRYLTDDRMFSLYGVAGFTADTRSSGGALPAIYSDNFLLLGAGVRVQPWTGLSAEVQLGFTHDLIARPRKATSSLDARAVAVFGIGMYPGISSPDEPVMPLLPLLDLYSAAGWYSRYENTIAYIQGRAGIRAFAYRATAVDVYARANLTLDSRQDFFNNTIEAGAGVRVVPDHRWEVTLQVEFLRGAYLGHLAGAPPDRDYSTVRVFVILDRFFCW